MSRKRKTAAARDYYEPWEPRQRAIPGPIPFLDGIPDYLDPEVADRIISTRARLAEESEWLLWGHRIHAPCEAVHPISPGEVVEMDDRGILATVRKLPVPKGSTTHREVAERIAACVNACRGIADPESTLSGLRELLFDLSTGSADAGDIRVTALLSRLLNQKEVASEAID